MYLTGQLWPVSLFPDGTAAIIDVIAFLGSQYTSQYSRVQVSVDHRTSIM